MARIAGVDLPKSKHVVKVVDDGAENGQQRTMAVLLLLSRRRKGEMGIPAREAAVRGRRRSPLLAIISAHRLFVVVAVGLKQGIKVYAVQAAVLLHLLRSPSASSFSLLLLWRLSSGATRATTGTVSGGIFPWFSALVSPQLMVNTHPARIQLMRGGCTPPCG